MTNTAVNNSMLDEEWLATPVRRSRLRTVLVVILAGALCFLGGAVVQKQFGTGSETASATGPAGLPGAQLPAGLPEGGLPALGGSAPTTDGPSDAAETDSVIGTVVKVRGTVWTVEDLGGERHRVDVSQDTRAIRESRTDITRVREGDRVDVSGNLDSGRLVADEVTLR
ncbi:hypothetical protein [Nocardioides sp.]|uniref:hypothetical protein n=1 Tax=Nocardioides sp. TaxID=35761 RepID=UPI003D0EBF49